MRGGGKCGGIVPPRAVGGADGPPQSRGSANSGAKPEPPDRRGQKGLLPALTELMPARRQRGLHPGLPGFQEASRRRQRDEVALGTQLSEQAAAHDRSNSAGTAELPENSEIERIANRAGRDLIVQFISRDDEGRTRGFAFRRE